MSARKPASRGVARRTASPAATPTADLVRSAGLPWFPFLSERVQIKLCRVNRTTGEMALIVRFEPGAGLGTHYYHGVVVVYCIRGHWRHLRAGWTAGPGDVLFEPAGSTHAMEVVGEEAVEAFIHITGAIEFRDEAGRTLCIENAETLHGRYLAHCALHGLQAADVARP